MSSPNILVSNVPNTYVAKGIEQMLITFTKVHPNAVGQNAINSISHLKQNGQVLKASVDEAYNFIKTNGWKYDGQIGEIDDIYNATKTYYQNLGIAW